MKDDLSSDNTTPTQYGLIGKSLSHSFSKKYFSNLFTTESIHAAYSLYEIETIQSVVSLVTEKGLKGFNVTIPYKESILPLLDSLSTEAQSIGAVNTVKVTSNGLIGHNTDAYGFKESIKPYLKRHHRKAMILGTGGAAKAVKYVLENLGLEVIMVSRNPTGVGQYAYEQINEKAVEIFPFIINCTPLGTFPNIEDAPDLPYHALNEQNFLFDLVYNPEETLFLKKGMDQGAQTLNGLNMLYFQAERAWQIWQNKA